MNEKNREALKSAVIEFKSDEVGGLVDQALKAGNKPLEILEALNEGLAVVGEKYENGEYFLSQLFMAADTMKMSLDILQPALALDSGEAESQGKLVLGTMEGDIHDFGKNTLSILLMASGIEVFDLGVDVSPVKFVEEFQKTNADVIGISALLSTTQPTSERVIKELEARGLRDNVKVILGGSGVSKGAVERFGVDAAVSDAAEGVRIINSWMKVNRK